MVGGHAWQERWLLQRMVRILLECILVEKGIYRIQNVLAVITVNKKHKLKSSSAYGKSAITSQNRKRDLLMDRKQYRVNMANLEKDIITRKHSSRMRTDRGRGLHGVGGGGRVCSTLDTLPPGMDLAPEIP